MRVRRLHGRRKGEKIRETVYRTYPGQKLLRNGEACTFKQRFVLYRNGRNCLRKSAARMDFYKLIYGKVSL